VQREQIECQLKVCQPAGAECTRCIPSVSVLHRYATLKVSSKAVKGDKDTHEHLADLAKELIKKNKVSKHTETLPAAVCTCDVVCTTVGIMLMCWPVQNCGVRL
jgi:hypothetical protein